MSNSKLVNVKIFSPNCNAPRNHAIDRITPHCVVGQCTVEALGNLFANSGRQASSNYGIGYDGRVGLFVDEGNRSWCSSSPANDHRAITIEVASDNYYPYAFNWVAYLKLVELCVDICERNGKNKLLWLGEAGLNYAPKANEMVLTAHRWFASTSCPGDWMYSRMGDLASRVTAALASRDYLMKGDTGEAVKNMQEMLIAIGYSCGKAGADGIFGEDTEAALLKFQKAAGLDVDGLYGEKSKKALTDKYLNKDGDDHNKNVMYMVQSGAYKVKANADKRVAALKSAGFPAIIKVQGDVYRVQVGIYKIKKNAEAAVANLKAKGFAAVILEV